MLSIILKICTIASYTLDTIDLMNSCTKLSVVSKCCAPFELHPLRFLDLHIPQTLFSFTLKKIRKNLKSRDHENMVKSLALRSKVLKKPPTIKQFSKANVARRKEHSNEVPGYIKKLVPAKPDKIPTTSVQPLHYCPARGFNETPVPHPCLKHASGKPCLL